MSTSLPVLAQQDAASFSQKYPETRKSNQQDKFFGKQVPDPYRWLEADTADETKDWVRNQNEVTDSYLARIPYRDALRKRLTQCWNYEKYGAPFTEGNYTYYFKNDGLQAQSVLYRERRNGGGKAAPAGNHQAGRSEDAEVFLDPNTFSKDGTVSLSGISFSKDGALMAYQTSDGGSDWTRVTVLETRTKTQVGDVLEDVKFSGISWKGNDGFYYSSYDKPKAGSQLSGKTDQHKLYWHKLNTAQNDDQLIFGGEKNAPPIRECWCNRRRKLADYFCRRSYLRK